VKGGNGQHDRTGKHPIIAAKLGLDESMKNVKNLYKTGFVSKDDFAAALRGHQGQRAIKQQKVLRGRKPLHSR